MQGPDVIVMSGKLGRHTFSDTQREKILQGRSCGLSNGHNRNLGRVDWSTVFPLSDKVISLANLNEEYRA